MAAMAVPNEYIAWQNSLLRDSIAARKPTEFRKSMKIGHYCNKAKKILHSLLLLFRICENFNYNSVGQLSPSIHTKTLRQLYNIKKPTAKRPEKKQNLDTTNSLPDFFLLPNPVILKL